MVDAYVLRCMHRRCNYDRKMVEQAKEDISASLHWGHVNQDPSDNKQFAYYLEQFKRSTVVDIAILPFIDGFNVFKLTLQHREKLLDIIHSMLQHQPFDLVTVHDEFKCHPNYVDYVRDHYRQILADLADSNLLDDLLSQIYKKPGTFPKLSVGLGNLIRQSEYALC